MRDAIKFHQDGKSMHWLTLRAQSFRWITESCPDPVTVRDAGEEDCIQLGSIISGNIYSGRDGLLRKVQGKCSGRGLGRGEVVLHLSPELGEGVDSYIVSARETLPNTARREESSLVGFRESRREIASGLDLTAVTDLRG